MTDPLITGSDGSRWRTARASFMDLYETGRRLILPLLIGCMLVDLGFIANALTTIFSMVNADLSPQQSGNILGLTNLYVLVHACLVVLSMTLIGIAMWVLRHALLWRQARQGRPVKASDRVLIAGIEIIGLSAAVLPINFGISQVITISLSVRGHLIPPNKTPTNSLVLAYENASLFMETYPLRTVTIEVVAFLLVYLAICNWPDRGNIRKDGSSAGNDTETLPRTIGGGATERR